MIPQRKLERLLGRVQGVLYYGDIQYSTQMNLHGRDPIDCKLSASSAV